MLFVCCIAPTPVVADLCSNVVSTQSAEMLGPCELKCNDTSTHSGRKSETVLYLFIFLEQVIPKNALPCNISTTMGKLHVACRENVTLFIALKYNNYIKLLIR